MRLQAVFARSLCPFKPLAIGSVAGSSRSTQQDELTTSTASSELVESRQSTSSSVGSFSLAHRTVQSPSTHANLIEPCGPYAVSVRVSWANRECRKPGRGRRRRATRRKLEYDVKPLVSPTREHAERAKTGGPLAGQPAGTAEMLHTLSANRSHSVRHLPGLKGPLMTALVRICQLWPNRLGTSKLLYRNTLDRFGWSVRQRFQTVRQLLV